MIKFITYWDEYVLRMGPSRIPKVAYVTIHKVDGHLEGNVRGGEK